MPEVMPDPQIVQVDRIEGIFYGINALSATGPASVSLIKPNLNPSPRIFTFSYSTFLNTRINAVSSDILVFT